MGEPGLAVIFFPIFLVASVGSCCLIGRQTGCRGMCACSESCCFAFRFWEIMFGDEGQSSATQGGELSLVGCPVAPAQSFPSFSAESTDSYSQGPVPRGLVSIQV